MWYAIKNDVILYQGTRKYTVLHEIMQENGGTKQNGSIVIKLINSCYLYKYKSDLIYIGRRVGLEAIGFSYSEDEWESAKKSAVSVPITKTAFILQGGTVKGFAENIPLAKRKVIEMENDVRKYPRFTKEENGMWRYVPQTPRIKRSVIYIATMKIFDQSEYGETVSQYRQIYRSLLIRRS